MTVYLTQRRPRLRPTLRLRLTLLNGILLVGAGAVLVLLASQLVGTYKPAQGQTVDFRLNSQSMLTRVRKVAPKQAITFPFTTYISDVVVDVERNDSTGHVMKVVRARYDQWNADSVRYYPDALGRDTLVIQVSPATGGGLDSLRFAFDTVQTGGPSAP